MQSYRRLELASDPPLPACPGLGLGWLQVSAVEQEAHAQRRLAQELAARCDGLAEQLARARQGEDEALRRAAATEADWRGRCSALQHENEGRHAGLAAAADVLWCRQA